MEAAVQGLAYVPGRARGVLSRHPAPGTIWLAEQDGLRRFSDRPAGCVLSDGAPFSHACIRLLSHGIPTVLLSVGQRSRLSEGTSVTLDAVSGRIFLSQVPDRELAALPGPLCTPAATADGNPITLNASVRDANGVRSARTQGAAGIGLVRTELLEPAGGVMPDASFYRVQFQAICDAAGPMPLTFRLLDLAADKRPVWAGNLASAGPLGLQGVRLYHRQPVACVVEAQLAAIARVEHARALRLLIPYIGDPEQFQHWRNWVRARLPADLPIGAMIETPAAALMVRELMEVADFVALGTNDLLQCLHGADRDEPELRAHLNPYSPAIYRFLQALAAAAGDHREAIQLCGILSQLPGVLPVLVGLGFRVFSVDAVHLPYLGQTLAGLSLAEAQQRAAAVCRAQGSRQVEVLLLGRALTG